MDLKERLNSHLTQLVRDRDPFLAPAGHFFVQQYIVTQFEQWGTVDYHEFRYGNRTHQNVILNLPGANTQNLPPILIGAHYDGVAGSPAADDNATGVAVLLEIARAIAQQPARFPLRLVAFDLEEYGLIGSREYAAKLKQQKQPLRLMMSLEMLGYATNEPHSQRYPAKLKYFYPHQGNFIGLIGNLRTIPDLIRLSRGIRQCGTRCEWLPVPKRGFIVPDTRRSDHAPFWDAGYPAMMVTDTANLRNPHYHLPSDRISTLNLEFLTGVCQSLIAVIQNL